MARRSSILVSLAVLCSTGCGVGPGGLDPVESDRCSDPVTNADAVVGRLRAARPELRQEIRDPAFESCVTRISDHEGHQHQTVVHVEARQQAYNSDATLILMMSRQVMDSRDSSLVGEVPELESTWRWSPTSSTTLYGVRGRRILEYDVVSSQERHVTGFDEYEELDARVGLAELPVDGSAVALVGRLPTGQYELFVFDFASSSKSPVVTLPLDGFGAAIIPEWVAVSPLGTTVLVQWPDAGSGRFQGVEAFDRQLRFIGQVSSGVGAGDLAIDSAGVQWWVDFSPSQERADSRPTIKKTRLPNREDELLVSVPLLEVDWFHDVRLSCRAPGVDWCAASVRGDPLSGWQPFEDEVFLLGLESTPKRPRVERLAHHQSDPAFIADHSRDDCPISPSSVEPRASISRDGTTVLFGSNWRTNCFAELYEVRR